MSDIQLRKLISKISLVIIIGGLSDSIHFNILPPELTIFSLGEILFLDEFGENIVRPMLNDFMSDKIISAAPSQKENYVEPNITTYRKCEIPNEFWSIWENEMGFNINQAAVILDFFDIKGIDDNAVIYFMRQSEIISLLQEKGISEDLTVKFINHFSLSPRPNLMPPLPL